VATDTGWPSGRFDAITAGLGPRRKSRMCGGGGVLGMCGLVFFAGGNRSFDMSY
jgi:hypothetical protein